MPKANEIWNDAYAPVGRPVRITAVTDGVVHYSFAFDGTGRFAQPVGAFLLDYRIMGA